MYFFSTLLCFSLLICLFINQSNGGPISETVHIDAKLTQFVKLASKSFNSTVFESREVWIVVYCEGEPSSAWKQAARDLIGTAWFGYVDVKRQKQLIAEQNIDISLVPFARVFPYAKDVESRLGKASIISHPGMLHMIIAESLPDLISDIKMPPANKRDKKKKIRSMESNLADFTTLAFSAEPTKFPVVILGDTDQPHIVFQALAYRLDRYFEFGYVSKAQRGDFVFFDLIPQDAKDSKAKLDLPTVFVYVFENDQKLGPQMTEFKYNKSAFGAMSYLNFMRFLISINCHFRRSLVGVGDNFEDDVKVANMKDVLEIEARRLTITVSKDCTVPKRNVKDEL